MKEKAIKPTDLVIPNRFSDVAKGDILSSYIFSTSSRSLSKYGERLLMEVISVAKEYLADAAFGEGKLNFGEKYNEKFAIVDIPIRNLLNEDDVSNYTNAKAAAVELMKIYHTVEAPVTDSEGNILTYDDGRTQYKFATYHLLDKVIINEKPGIVSVKLGADTWSQILDMGKGYTRYNLITARRLNNVVAIRLFQLMSNSDSLHFTIEKIKGILGLQDKYVSNVSGFVARVIVPAEKEINDKCPFVISHELTYSASEGRGRSSVSGITFLKKSKSAKVKDIYSVLSSDEVQYLVRICGFKDDGIRANLAVFYAVKGRGVDIVSAIGKILPTARKAANMQGYIIKSLQNLNKAPKNSNSDMTGTYKSGTGKNARLKVDSEESYQNNDIETL